MGVSVCPIAVINKPIEQVWSFISEPENYALWWDAETRRIVPEGPAQIGQMIYAQTREFGRYWDMTVLVEGVEADKHLIHLKSSLPFGITAYNHFTCTAMAGGVTQVSFG